MADQTKLAPNVLNNQLETQNLEKQVGHPNPKQVNIVSTWSGRPLEELPLKAKVAEEKGTQVDEAEPSEQRVDEEPKAKPPPLFPQKFKKQKEEECFGKFIELLKQVHVNLPLIDVLQGIPKYAKYVKDVVANKSRLVEYATVALTEECSSRIQNRLPIKLKDPGSFTVQIKIGQCVEARGLCDLGASINLRPTSMFLKLGQGRPKSTTIMLQLADRSVARPDGVIEDVLVQKGTLIFPVDFVIMDFEPNLEVPFILGRPFLATGGALIDVVAGRLTMRAHDKVEVFDVYKAMKLPAIYEEMSAITVIDEAMVAKYVEAQDPLEKVLIGQDIEGDVEAQELANVLNIPNVSILRNFVEPLNRVLSPHPKPSIEEAPKLELKALPSHLKYAFLGANEYLHVILSSALSELQVEASLKILRKRKRVIGWQMADINGINPTLCMHMIFMKEGHKSIVQPQRKLNPMMKDVVRREVIKWLDTGIIYPISDIKWVSLIQCVPKKGGMEVITNERNELIPTRTITRWRICMDYRKLNEATRKDHYLVPFIDQMLDRCLENLDRVLARCEETNLILNREKCHFLVKEGIVLGHKVSKRFIKDFSMIARPMCSLLEKEMKFVFDEQCMQAFKALKKKLTEAPILTSSKWELPFELMCDANDMAMGAMFRSYIVGTKVVVYTDHAAIGYLFNKNDAKPRLIRWILLLQEFDIEIKDR
ncbi:uncharacterized protein LOC125836054 [Solanum verrucosum]|uniref:uncharacterized protein LOC125836054 n=1 Tax=Solanum verrucosum TaxID=315347 RepID=UPI0020D1E35C|nr:uncharacterized protein LOC125836054 [Solanum verrucosum]